MPTAAEVMRDAPVIPVIVLEDVNHAVPLARALVAGGIRMLEVTLRTPAALACIERIAQEVPEAVAGAGTVRCAADAAAAFRAEARGRGWRHVTERAPSWTALRCPVARQVQLSENCLQISDTWPVADESSKVS